MKQSSFTHEAIMSFTSTAWCVGSEAALLEARTVLAEETQRVDATHSAAEAMERMLATIQTKDTHAKMVAQRGEEEDSDGAGSHGG